ncbi:antiterminator Q family protein [Winslowiella arboricola]|uniref:antiterminator Q family protein n=1 Tax=Winslowiella arboricola TaxID=2978220 RepID=UPI00225DEA78|nr:antiterminator Q family protein [Winslowiella arboricola]MCU5775209.1 antiterminator Q family protein [Winslowiella arboricola]
MRDIQLVLERWGVWSRSRPEGDYSPIAAGFKGLLVQSGGAHSCTDNDASIVDACVGRLKQKRPDEHELIEDHYIKGISKRQLARKHKCDEKLIRIKFSMAEGFVDGCLAMLDISLEMDPYTQRKIIAEPIDNY